MLWACAGCAQDYRVQASHTTENLRGISAVSSSVVWASGTHGTYLRTTNGGSSWTAAQVPGAESLDFRDVEAFDANEAYLLAAGPGEQSRIYKTTDGGKHWTSQFTNHGAKGFFDCMAFWDRHHGIAVGDPVDGKFELIATEDGDTWTPITPGKVPPAKEGEGAFAASGTCVAIQGENSVWFVTGGKGARVFRSNDRGKTWTVAETPLMQGSESAGGFSIAFRDAMHGLIAGGDYKNPERGGANLAFSEDGGNTWKLSSLAPQCYFSAAGFTSKGILAGGTTHSGYSGDLRTWKKYWELDLNALHLLNTGEAFGVGPKGIVVRFNLAR